MERIIRRSSTTTKRRVLMALTVARLLLVPALMISFMTNPALTSVCLGAFIVADHFDGVLARRLGLDGLQRRATDTIVDRVAIGLCLLAATLAGVLPPLLLLGFVARDIYCALVCGYLLYKRRVVIKADLVFRIPSFLFASWVLSAPFVATSYSTPFASVTLLACLVVAADLSASIQWVLRMPPGECDGVVIDAGTARRVRRRRGLAEQLTVDRNGHVAQHSPSPTLGLH